MSSSLSQLTTDLHKHPEILNVSDSDVLHNFLNGNFSLPNASILLQQLDTIDNAACGWVRFMAKVRWNPPVGRLNHPQPGSVGLKRVRSTEIFLRAWNKSPGGMWWLLWWVSRDLG